MKTSFLLIATLVLTTSAFAGMIVDRANNMKLVSTCIELDPSGDEGACSVIEVTGAINKKFVLSKVEYGDFRETELYEYINSTAIAVHSIGYLTQSRLLMYLAIPVTAPVGIAIDALRAPFVTTKLIKSQRTVHLIKFLFNFASDRTKTVSHAQFHDIINQLN